MITVNAVNDAPWVNGTLNNITTTEDTGNLDNIILVADFNANFSDVEDANPTTYELVSTTNSSTSCWFDVSNNFNCSTIVNQSGVDYYTISLNDSGGLSVIYDWMITVNAVNDQPWMTDSIGFNNVTVNEDTGTFITISNDSFAGNFSDVEDNNNPITTILSQSDESAVECSISSGALSCTTTANMSGTNDVLLNLSDTGGLSFVMSTLITISAVNDVPLNSYNLKINATTDSNYTNDTIYAEFVVGSDEEGEIIYNITWYNNGLLNLTFGNITNSTPITLEKLESENTTKGE